MIVVVDVNYNYDCYFYLVLRRLFCVPLCSASIARCLQTAFRIGRFLGAIELKFALSTRYASFTVKHVVRFYKFSREIYRLKSISVTIFVPKSGRDRPMLGARTEKTHRDFPLSRGWVVSSFNSPTMLLQPRVLVMVLVLDGLDSVRKEGDMVSGFGMYCNAENMTQVQGGTWVE